MYQITCSTIVHTLDYIVKDGRCKSRSVHETKKMKRQKSTPSNEVICDGENALSLLSSLLGILLFKKDIEKRLVLSYTATNG